MAGAKTHEMLFTLAAKQQASFGSAFSGARQEFQSLYNQAAQLTAQQNDISAYTKQQSAIESTQNSLQRYQEKLANVRAALDQMKSSGEGTTQETLKLQQQEAELAFKVSETSRKLTEQEEKLGTMGGKLEEAGVDTSNLSAEQDRIQQELTETKGKMDEIDSSGSFMDSAADSLEAFGSVAMAVGAGKIFEEIVSGMKACADAAADFEYGMSAVAAIASSSEEELGELSTKAQEIGATTMYTATEAADALSYMALAGWDSQEMLSGVDGVIQLAAASGEDLASVSDIVTDALTAFGLTAADSAGFVDVLAAAATNSNTTVNMLGEAFKYAAPVAGALGYSVTDVAVAMGLMANNGIKGSMAGTSLRNIFNALTGELVLTSDAFGEVEFSGANADGTMKPLSETIADLKYYFGQMSEAEQVANAQAMAGTRAYAGLLAILNTTEDDYNSLTEAIENSTGAAEQMANTRMDNMTGQLTLLESAFNGLQIAVGNNFIPVLSELYSTGADVLSWMTEVANENPALVSGITTTTAAVGGLTSAMLALNAVKKAAKKLDLASLLPSAAAAVPIAAVAAILGTYAAAVADAKAIEKEAHDSAYELTGAWRDQADEIVHLQANYGYLVQSGQGASAQAQELRQQINTLQNEFENGAESVDEFAARIASMGDEVSASSVSYNDAMARIDDQEESTANLVARLQELSTQASLTAADEAEMSAIVDILNGRYEDLNLTVDDLISKGGFTPEAIEAAARAAAETEKLNTATQTYNANYARQEELAQNVTAAQENATAAQEDYEAALEAVTEKQAAGRTVSLEETEAVAALYNAWQDQESALSEATVAQSENSETMQAALDVMLQYGEAQENAAGGTGTWEDSLNTTANAALELAAAYEDAYEAALQMYEGVFGIYDQAAETQAASMDDLNAALVSQTDYWNTYSENLETVKARIQELNAEGVDTSGLETYLAVANDGTPEAAAAIAALASSGEEDLLALNDNFSSLQDAQSATAESAGALAVGFDAAVQDMVDSLQGGVSDMALPGEASSAAASTMSAYLSTVNSYGATIISKAQSIAAQVAAALASGSGGSVGGFAEGTDYAPPGWAWVGENGPELMYFHGGEQVVPHAESERLMQQMEQGEAYADVLGEMEYAESTDAESTYDADISGTDSSIVYEYEQPQEQNAITITVSPVIQITGVSDSAGLLEVSDELVEQLKETVMDAIEQAGIDRARRAY